MSQLLEDALSRDGVAVTRAACPEAAGAACAACLAAGLDGLERKLALPQTMAERMRGPSLRHFVPVCTTVSAAVSESATTRSDRDAILTVLRRGTAFGIGRRGRRHPRGGARPGCGAARAPGDRERAGRGVRARDVLDSDT